MLITLSHDTPPHAAPHAEPPSLNQGLNTGRPLHLQSMSGMGDSASQMVCSFS